MLRGTERGANDFVLAFGVGVDARGARAFGVAFLGIISTVYPMLFVPGQRSQLTLFLALQGWKI